MPSGRGGSSDASGGSTASPASPSAFGSGGADASGGGSSLDEPGDTPRSTNYGTLPLHAHKLGIKMIVTASAVDGYDNWWARGNQVHRNR